MKTVLLISLSLLSSLFAYPGLSQEMLKPIAPKFKPDPIVMEGIAEGIIPFGKVTKVEDKCSGFANTKPNYVLPLKSDFAYLNLKVRGEGLVLLVDGPDGIFCRPDNGEISGMWKAGNYQIWIGTKQKNKSKYRLSLSESNQ